MPSSRGWAQWEWLDYLQRRNPNIPALAHKLEPPAARGSLAWQTRYWERVMTVEPVRCIYSGVPLNGRPFELDHFVPWSFVCHDRLWNLVPVQPDTNLEKGNWLPHRDYLEPFIELEERALRACRQLFAGQKRQFSHSEDAFGLGFE